MKYQKIDKKQKEKIAEEYWSGSNTYFELEIKYGIPVRTIQRWVKKFKRNSIIQAAPNISRTIRPGKVMPDNVKQLQEELNKVRLHNLLLEELLDIGKEEYGIDLRKKTGAKQS